MSLRFSARAVAGPRASFLSLSGTCFRPIRNTAAAEPVSAESSEHHSNAADAGLSANRLRDAVGAAPSQPMMRATPSQAASPKAVSRSPFFPIRSLASTVAPEGMAELSHGAG